MSTLLWAPLLLVLRVNAERLQILRYIRTLLFLFRSLPGFWVFLWLPFSHFPAKN